MEIVSNPKPTSAELFARIKRVFGPRINSLAISDDDIKSTIEDILRGTRNVHYMKKLNSTSTGRDICNYILREYH